MLNIYFYTYTEKGKIFWISSVINDNFCNITTIHIKDFIYEKTTISKGKMYLILYQSYIVKYKNEIIETIFEVAD